MITATTTNCHTVIFFLELVLQVERLRRELAQCQSGSLDTIQADHHAELAALQESHQQQIQSVESACAAKIRLQEAESRRAATQFAKAQVGRMVVHSPEPSRAQADLEDRNLALQDQVKRLQEGQEEHGAVAAEAMSTLRGLMQRGARSIKKIQGLESEIADLRALLARQNGEVSQLRDWRTQAWRSSDALGAEVATLSGMGMNLSALSSPGPGEGAPGIPSKGPLSEEAKTEIHASIQAAAAELFGLYDRDSNGWLDVEEVGVLVQALKPGKGQLDISRMMAAWDRNADGRVNQAEFGARLVEIAARVGDWPGTLARLQAIVRVRKLEGSRAPTADKGLEEAEGFQPLVRRRSKDAASSSHQGLLACEFAESEATRSARGELESLLTSVDIRPTPRWK